MPRSTAGADMVGFVFFPPSPRHLDFLAAQRSRRAASAAVPARSRSRSMPTTRRFAAHRRGAAARHAAAARPRDRRSGSPRSSARFGLPVMKAHAGRSSAPISPRSTAYAAVADRLLFDARAPRDATRPGGLGKPFDWHAAARTLTPRVPFMLSGGLDAGNVAEALRGHARAGGVDVSSGVERAPGEKDPDKIRAFIRAARAGGSATRSPKDREPRMTVQQAQFLPHRPRRARPFRHLRRPLRRRDADAADPRAGAGLRGGQGRSGLPGRDGRLPHALCRPAEPALFRRAPDRASAAAPKSISSARS